MKNKAVFSRLRRAHLRVGRRGERWAAALLKEMGFSILTCNYVGKKGEIDIIARNERGLSFVEVKTRRRPGWTRPGAAVGPAKRRRIIKTAHRYLREIGFPPIVYRFDVIEVILNGRGLRDIQYWPNAFNEEILSSPLDMRFPDMPAEYVRAVNSI